MKQCNHFTMTGMIACTNLPQLLQAWCTIPSSKAHIHALLKYTSGLKVFIWAWGDTLNTIKWDSLVTLFLGSIGHVYNPLRILKYCRREASFLSQWMKPITYYFKHLRYVTNNLQSWYILLLGHINIATLFWSFTFITYLHS